MIFGQRVPGFGLGGLHPGQHVGGEQGTGAVVASGITFSIQPAVLAEVLADFILEADFFMQAHYCCYPVLWLGLLCKKSHLNFVEIA